MKAPRLIAAATAALHLMSALPAMAQLTISQTPFDIGGTAPPAVIFGLDDSGSMDSEVMLRSNDGAAWFNTNTGSFINGSAFNYNDVGDAKNNWYKFVYLFPNGDGAGERQYPDKANDHFAIPPIDAFAWVRSSDWNPIYYDSLITYEPWTPGYVGGSLVTYGAADPAKAKSHPVFGSSTVDLTQAVPASTAANKQFTFLSGMTIPGATVPGISGKTGATFSPVTTDTLVTSGSTWRVAMPYYPATFYVKDSTCGGACPTGPDGVGLRKYEIKPGNTFPSGRSYAAEMQNFANWFQYYRKRKLMLGAAMGEVLTQIKGIRGGIVRINNLNTVKMYDFSSKDPATNAARVIGEIYANPANGGTPNREALKHIGGQFVSNPDTVLYACQANSAFILTDGFANASNVTVGSYDAKWFSGSPYQTIHDSSLADIAAYYYATNVRPDLAKGLAPSNKTSSAADADKNDNLHMNTYALTLGARGTIFGVDAALTADPYSATINWPNPNQNRHPSAVDDLWHATIVGRGAMYVADSAEQVAKEMKDGLTRILTAAATRGALAMSGSSFRAGDSVAYMSSFNAQTWSGDLFQLAMTGANGDVDVARPDWSAAKLLDARASSSRIIVAGDGGAKPFQAGSLSGGYTSELTSDAGGTASAAQVVAFLRGDRSLEGTGGLRKRSSVLGDIVHANPTYVGAPNAGYGDAGYSDFAVASDGRRALIVQPANDGMVHVFDAATGVERWAYIPEAAKANLGLLASPGYDHRYFVDASPFVGDVKLTSGWKTLAVGGLGAGGSGYYALELSGDLPATEAAAAAKVLWDFPSSAPAVKANVGYTYGKPVFVKTAAAGWVVLVTSGYNNGDGKGHLFALDPNDGSLIADVVTPEGSSTQQIGLAHVAAFATNGVLDAATDFAYGGDLQGNIWRFDLTGNANTWKAVKLATLTDHAGKPQAITSPLEIASVDGVRMVYAVTGKLLESADMSLSQVQSAYGIKDDMSAKPLIKFLRGASGALVEKELVVGAGEIRNVTASKVDLIEKSGWYFDLPSSGERGLNAPVAAFGLLIFTTNVPSGTACSNTSFLYAVGLGDGNEAKATYFKDESPWSGRKLGNLTANDPVVMGFPPDGARVKVTTGDRGVLDVRLPVEGGGFRRVGWQEIFR